MRLRAATASPAFHPGARPRLGGLNFDTVTLLRAMLGETEAARERLEHALSERVARTDAEANQYRRFATEASQWITEHEKSGVSE